MKGVSSYAVLDSERAELFHEWKQICRRGNSLPKEFIPYFLKNEIEILQCLKEAYDNEDIQEIKRLLAATDLWKYIYQDYVLDPFGKWYENERSKILYTGERDNPINVRPPHVPDGYVIQIVLFSNGSYALGAAAQNNFIWTDIGGGEDSQTIAHYFVSRKLP